MGNEKYFDIEILKGFVRLYEEVKETAYFQN